MSANPGAGDVGASAATAAAIWQPAYVGVGSNLDEPREQVRLALEELASLPHSLLIARSPLYRSAPLLRGEGDGAQPGYVNAVAGLLTRLTPEELLGELRRIETRRGRAPARERWAPRRIDLDLLVFGRETRATDTLRLPHPEIAARDFVLYPLADIAPDLEVPGLGRVSALRARVTDRGMERL